MRGIYIKTSHSNRGIESRDKARQVWGGNKNGECANERINKDTANGAYHSAQHSAAAPFVLGMLGASLNP